MNKLNSIFKCNLCGNMVEMTHAEGGTLVCCGKEMNYLAENTTEAATEKHIPVMNELGSELEIKVGSVTHPMADDHYIEWIEITSDDQVYRKHLKPGDEPVAKFSASGKFSARAYCNLHGLWKHN